MKFSEKRFFASISFLLCIATGFSAEEVSSVKFLGIYSSDTDRNTLNMTEDFYYKQISEYVINLTYKKDEAFQTGFEADRQPFFEGYDGSYIFFMEIKKDSDSKWICSYNLRNQSDGSIKTISREYESYYKILMESKTSFRQTFSELFSPASQDLPGAKPQKAPVVTTEAISGTWQSSEAINKIVIMRGGRGFIIFKNGATMNIKVSVSDSEPATVVVTQSSGNNASFYPELERKTAMEYAISASPVTWELLMQDDGSLKGSKNSPIEKDGQVTEGKIAVTWTKAN